MGVRFLSLFVRCIFVAPKTKVCYHMMRGMSVGSISLFCLLLQEGRKFACILLGTGVCCYEQGRYRCLWCFDTGRTAHPLGSSRLRNRQNTVNVYVCLIVGLSALGEQVGDAIRSVQFVFSIYMRFGFAVVCR